MTWQTMVSAPLNVERHKIKTEAGVLGLEEMVGHLLGEDVVELLSWLCGQTNQELVQFSRRVDQT